MTTKDKKSETKNKSSGKTVEPAELGKRAKDLVQDAGHTASAKVRGAAQDISDKASEIVHNVAHDVRRAAADVEEKSKK